MGCACKANKKTHRKWLRFNGQFKPSTQPTSGGTDNNIVVKK